MARILGPNKKMKFITSKAKFNTSLSKIWSFFALIWHKTRLSQVQIE